MIYISYQACEFTFHVLCDDALYSFFLFFCKTFHICINMYLYKKTKKNHQKHFMMHAISIYMYLNLMLSFNCILYSF